MALMQVSNMQQEVWDSIGDFDASNRSVDATTLLRVLNKCYSHIKGFEDNRVYYVPANVSGASIAPQVGSLWVTLTEKTYRNILECYPAQNNAATTPFGPSLEWMEQWELFNMQNEDNTDRQIFGSAWTAWRQGATPSSGNVGKFNFAVWPVSSVVHDYLLGVLREVTALVNQTDIPDGSEEDHHYVCDMTSLIMGRWMGRSEEWLGDIRARLPEQLLTATHQLAKDIGLVKPRPGQEAA